MNTINKLILAATFISSLSAQEVQTLGVTKRAYYQQESADRVVLVDYSFVAFIEGEDLDESYPPPPSTLTTPGGTVYEFEFDEDLWYVEDYFVSKSQFEAAFPNGTYVLRADGVSVSLALTGDAYPITPKITSSAGKWVDGKLQISKSEAAAGFSLESNTSNGNGFVSLEIEGNNVDYYEFTYAETGSSVRTEVPGGALVLGGSYTAFLDFDHVTQAIRVLSFGPDSWAFALYSTTTMVDIEVVEDTPSTSEVTVSISFTRANDGSPRLTLNWNSTDTQRWQVETSTNLSQWSPLGGPVVSTVGANSVSLPYAQETGRFFRLKAI